MLQDGVLDRCEDEADVLCVCGAGEVRVDDLVAIWVQIHKHLQDELAARLGIPLRTCELVNESLETKQSMGVYLEVVAVHKSTTWCQCRLHLKLVKRLLPSNSGK